MSYEISKHVDQNFKAVDKDKQNSALLESIVDANSELIVQRLKQIEKEWGDPFADKQLLKTVLTPEMLSLPLGEQRKWIAAICIASSDRHQFSWGNLFVPSEDL